MKNESQARGNENCIGILYYTVHVRCGRHKPMIKEVDKYFQAHFILNAFILIIKSSKMRYTFHVQDSSFLFSFTKLPQWNFIRKEDERLIEFVIAHIAQNIADTCQKYFQFFIATETLSQHFCQILQNISSQIYNFNFLKYFWKQINI